MKALMKNELSYCEYNAPLVVKTHEMEEWACANGTPAPHNHHRGECVCFCLGLGQRESGC